MAELPHYFYFFNKTLFAVLFAICCLFGECLYCIFTLIFDFLHQVHGCKVAFPYFLDRLESLVKPFLIEIQP